MALASAASTLFMPRLQPTFPWKSKSTSSCGGTNKSSETAAKVHAKRVPQAAAATKMPQLLDLESRKHDGVCDMFAGRLLGSGLVFQQNFGIRSYELGPDGKATIGCLMKRLQETSIQHCRSLGLFAGGFGSTPEMNKRGLVWVLLKVQLVVEKYPSWSDVMQIDTWVGASGNNGLFRDWIFRDYRTGEVLIKATGFNVMMNMKTRKFCKFIPEIRAEMEPGFMDFDPLIDIINTKLRRLDCDTRNYVQTGLTPTWSDLDVNQHVSHAKYIDWIFESIPVSILESQELSSLTLEFRKECKSESVLQSVTAVAGGGIGHDSNHNEGAEFDHLLRLESGAEILRANTMWRPKGVEYFSALKIPATN